MISRCPASKRRAAFESRRPRASKPAPKATQKSQPPRAQLRYIPDALSKGKDMEAVFRGMADATAVPASVRDSRVTNWDPLETDCTQGLFPACNSAFVVLRTQRLANAKNKNHYSFADFTGKAGKTRTFPMLSSLCAQVVPVQFPLRTWIDRNFLFAQGWGVSCVVREG